MSGTGPTPAELPTRPRLPGPIVPPIPGPEVLVHAGRADRRPWEMSGRRARLRLDGLTGVGEVEGDGRLLLTRIEVVGATGANILLGPRTSRREVVLPGGSLRETSLVPDLLPGAIVQWTGEGAAGHRPIPLRLVLPEGLARGSAHEAPGLLWVGRGDDGVLLHAPGSESVPELVGSGADWSVRWDLSPGEGPATLLVMAAPERGDWTSLPALAGVAAHHRRGEIMARGSGEAGVELETGVEALDQGVLWARSWLRDRLLTPTGATRRIHRTEALTRVGDGLLPEVGHSGDAAAWIARGAAASGDWEAARAALAAMSWETPWLRLHAALALARYTAWTGDGRPLEEQSERVFEAFSADTGLQGIPEPVVTAVWETVRAAGEAAEVEGMASLPRPTPPPKRSRQLPVLGSGPPPGPPESPDHPWLGPLGFRQAPSSLARARSALGEVAADPRVLLEGVGARGMLELVEGMLGARPDATFSRLALSPLLPPSWTRFRVQGIRTGEGILQLDYRREGDRAVWTLVPREGSVPLTAIFHPWHPWARVTSVRVDDQEAELDVESLGDWSRLDVQIPVDGEHTIEVRGEGPLASDLPREPSPPGVSPPSGSPPP
ncbi:MAG: hypothetical protein P8188_06715 [Gemmatimonadota bacterium]